MSPSIWGTSPRASIAAACRRYSQERVAQACMDLLAGRDVEVVLLEALGGPGAAARAAGPVHRYWLRVWAVRGLLWNWDDRAAALLDDALQDESWRVREMAAKVVARHLLGERLNRVAALANDPVPRVRFAAERALRLLVEARA